MTVICYNALIVNNDHCVFHGAIDVICHGIVNIVLYPCNFMLSMIWRCLIITVNICNKAKFIK
jgi:hypothetical protein